MAWSTPKTFVAGDTLTHTDLNNNLYYNMNETLVAKASVPGQLFASLGNNVIDPVSVATIDGSFTTTTSTSYVTVTGTTLVVPACRRAIVIWSGEISTDAGVNNRSVLVAAECVGWFTASDNWALQQAGNDLTNHGYNFAGSMSTQMSNMDSSDKTFRLRLRSTNGDTASINGPQLTVIPL